MASSSDQEDSSYMIWVEEGGGPGSKLGLGLGLGLGKKRRFSEEQVKSLELMFETQAKLDPRKKLQLAKDLGLHPRQVAIWFQNKRARWKSKQLEREYAALKADYDALLSSFDSLKTEKQALAKQLHKLAEVFDKQVLQDQRSGKEDEKSVPWIEKSDIDEENNREKEDQLGRLYAEPAVAGDETLQAVPMTEQHFLFPPSCWPTPASSQWWDFWPMNG